MSKKPRITFDVLVEIPKGSRNKYEYDFELKKIQNTKQKLSFGYKTQCKILNKKMKKSHLVIKVNTNF